MNQLDPSNKATVAIPALFRSGDRDGPDFICIGAQKAGTRWLYDQLSFHPDFWMPPIKEIGYLDRQSRGRRAEEMREKAITDFAKYNRQRVRRSRRPLTDLDIEWLEAFIWLQDQPFDMDLYKGLFACAGDRLSGDVTPDYCVISDQKLEMVRRRLAGTRIIYLVRDPIARFWSQCRMYAHNQQWSEDLGDVDAICAFIQRSRSVQQSRVTGQIQRWRAAFGDQFAYFFFDDIRDRPDVVRNQVVSFLGGGPSAPQGLSPDHNTKAGMHASAMSEPVRQFVVSVLGEEVVQAARLLGGPAEAWPQKYGL